MKYGEKGFYQHATVCQCMSTEHQFVFTFDPQTEDNEYQECYLDIHLHNPCQDGHRPLGKFFCGKFWRRCWYGIRYILGYKSKYGAWDSTIVAKEEARKLRDMLDQYVLFCDSKEKEQPVEKKTEEKKSEWELTYAPSK